MRGTACPSQDLGGLEPSKQAKWKTKKPSPGESGTLGGFRVPPLGSSSHQMVERVLAEGLCALLPIVPKALDVGTGVGGLPRGCSDAAEKLQKPPQPGGLRALLPRRLK